MAEPGSGARDELAGLLEALGRTYSAPGDLADALDVVAATSRYVRVVIESILKTNADIPAGVVDGAREAEQSVNQCAARLSSAEDELKRLAGTGLERRTKEIAHEVGNFARAATRQINEAALALMLAERLERGDELLESRKLLDETRKLKGELESASSAIQSTTAAADAALKVAQQAATDAGLNAQGRAFAAARQRYGRVAGLWLAAAAAALVALLGAWIWMLFAGGPPLPNKEWTLAGNLAHFGARVFLLSVPSFLLVVCVRNYLLPRTLVDGEARGLSDGHHARRTYARAA